MSRRLTTAASITATLLLAACTAGHDPASPAPAGSGQPSATGSAPPVAHSLSSSGLILHGRVRCTARIPGPLEPGHRTGLTFALHNISRRTVKATFSNWTYGFVLHAAHGVRYDSQVPLAGASGPVPVPQPIRPGATRTFRPADVWVRWSGPVSIRPVCSDVKLPAMAARVVASGPAPPRSRVIADVVAAAGHLFDKCRPARFGTPVTGAIDPPSGNAPPLRAACSMDVQREGQFWVVRSLVLVPPDLQGVDVRQPYESVELPDQHRSAEALAWTFVDTADGARPVAADTADTTEPAGRMAPDWDWTGHRWEGPGGSRCGGQLSTGGGGPGLDIEFVSVCPS